MNNRIQLPIGFQPPREVVCAQYVLEVLAPRHNDIDYDAWTSSRDELQGIFGPTNDWPPYHYTLEQNLADLARHYREFEEHVAYTYTILTVDRTVCIGCLYIRPTRSVQHDARVDFWFRNSSKNIEPIFYDELQRWLQEEWQFTQAAFPGRSLSWSAYEAFVNEKK